MPANGHGKPADAPHHVERFLAFLLADHLAQ
jgi:hypothetical protein